MGSALVTDGYKFSMGEAGWPLREETFYWSHRRGGPQLLPFDVAAEIRAVLPTPTEADFTYLAQHGYACGPGVQAALGRAAQVQVAALPPQSVFFPREPIASVTGPSTLVSWLEPLVLTWNFRVQVASLARFAPERLPTELAVLTCERQRQLVLETLDAVGVAPPPMRVDSGGYVMRVRAKAAELVSIVGDGSRVFEVGLRSASCVEQHLLALEGCRQAGVSRTSHVFGARQLAMTPVGTMGHEHVQRYGSDAAAFRAMVERRPSSSSFLLDTYDTVKSGIPNAFALIAKRAGQGDSIRYDSGDKVAQYRFAAQEARARGIRPVQILEDGFDAEQTRTFEALRAEEGIAPGEQVYGYGGYLVAGPSGTSLTRDRVQAVYKLSQTGDRPTMKFGNESGEGKQSIPGRPVVFRRVASGAGPIGIVGQNGEAPPAGYRLLTGAEPSAQSEWASTADLRLDPSPATRALIDRLRQEAFRA